MEAVGQLAGGIAHDFNNMLMAIQGFAGLLEDEIPPSPTAHAHLREIRKAADRSAGLTRQLLAYSRKQVLQPKVIELNGIITGIDDMLRRLIGEHILFQSVLDPDKVWVHADLCQLQQVLMNLVLNSRDAMTDGGRLVVRTSSHLVIEDVELGDFALPAGNYAVLTVSDTGVGIPAAILPRIFEPFFTTKAVGLGSGLGLSTVYGIVKQSGGYIHATSKVGEGSSFVIYLPRTSKPVEVEPPPAAEKPSSEGTATILVAEDELVLRSLAALVLRRGGFRVIEAEDGIDALRLAEEAGYKIDVLVTDLVMPRMGGEALAATLLERRPELKIVFMSGYAEDVVARQGLIAADSSFLEKPFPPKVLLQAVRDAVTAE
jgi:CheY-like chemotaxis protein